MDVQLQELIEKIKKDGVAAAEKSASEKIAEAEAKAAKIIADAKEEADKIINTAKDETARMEKASEDAIRQASRNLIISFRDVVTKELSSLVKADVEKTYSSDLLKNLIPEVVKAWVEKSDAESVSVLLSEKDLSSLENGFKSALKSEIEKGLEIKADKSINTGFKIGVENGAAFIDLTDESIAQLFSSYLNPKVASLMKEASK